MGTGVEVAIRSAGPADAPALAALRFRLRAEVAAAAEAEEAFLSRCERWMAERLAEASAWRCWVAEAGDRLVGTVWLHLIEKLPNPVAEPERHGYVSSLFVEPDRRGAGLGARLLGEALREAEARQVDAVLLWPTPRSRSLYERHGFAVRGDLLVRRGSP